MTRCHRLPREARPERHGPRPRLACPWRCQVRGIVKRFGSTPCSTRSTSTSRSTRSCASSAPRAGASRRCCAASTGWSDDAGAHHGGRPHDAALHRAEPAPERRRHGLPGLQPLPPLHGAGQCHARAGQGAAALEGGGRGAARRAARAWGFADKAANIPTGSRAGSSSAWRSPARWRCSRRRCCSTRSPAPLDPELSTRCSSDAGARGAGHDDGRGDPRDGFARRVADQSASCTTARSSRTARLRRSSRPPTTCAPPSSLSARWRPGGCARRCTAAPSHACRAGGRARRPLAEAAHAPGGGVHRPGRPRLGAPSTCLRRPPGCAPWRPGDLAALAARRRRRSRSRSAARASSSYDGRRLRCARARNVCRHRGREPPAAGHRARAGADGAAARTAGRTVATSTAPYEPPTVSPVAAWPTSIRVERALGSELAAERAPRLVVRERQGSTCGPRSTEALAGGSTR